MNYYRRTGTYTRTHSNTCNWHRRTLTQCLYGACHGPVLRHYIGKAVRTGKGVEIVTGMTVGHFDVRNSNNKIENIKYRWFIETEVILSQTVINYKPCAADRD